MVEVLSTGARETRTLRVELSGVLADKRIVFDPAISAGGIYQEAKDRVQEVEEEQRRALAEKFAEEAYGIDGVREVRLTTAQDELIITVFTEERDLTRDLQLQQLLVSLVGQRAGETTLRTLVARGEGAEEYGQVIQR